MSGHLAKRPDDICMTVSVIATPEAIVSFKGGRAVLAVDHGAARVKTTDLPAFQAINVELEEDVEDEIDTLKELQVDDALKLFQTALKLHAQGPSSYDDAEKAYEELFQSEIFKYPEAATEYDRVERQPDQPDLTALSATTPTFGPELTVVTPADIDGAGTSLPQALYLAHKNRGQLVVDRLRHEAKKNKASPNEFFCRSDVVDNARSALVEFYSALDRDPSDAELWRRASRVAAFLKSTRTSRYCLEAAVELDDDPAVLEVQPPSLVEGLAGEQLKNQLSVLSDDMALSHPVMAPWMDREVPQLIKRFLDPIPFLPDPAQDLGGTRVDYDALHREKAVIAIPGPSWKDLGFALVEFATEQGISGDAITLDVPDLPDEDTPMEESPHASGELDDDDRHDSPSAQLRAEVGSPEEIQSKSPASEDDKAVDEAQKPPADETQKCPEADRKDRSASAPNRKRSQSTAGVTEGQEEENGTEKRSKRTRRRETLPEETVDPSALYASKIAEYQAADKNLFQMTKDILENLGVTDTATLDALAEVLESCDSEDRLSKFTSLASSDLRTALTAFNEPIAKILSGKKEQPSLSLSSFLEHAKGGSQKLAPAPAFEEAKGLKAFVNKVNAGWFTIHDVAFEWMKRLCPSYLTSKWPDEMKVAVVQLTSRLDAELYGRVAEELSAIDKTDGATDSSGGESLVNLIQMLFELHLDVYERITNPNSIVEYSVRVETRGRLERWQDLASTALRRSARPATDPICLRFIWASIFSTGVLEPHAPRDHILQCYASFRSLLVADECEPIYLPNNAIIPVISSDAVDREISKLTTMDFFLGLFQDDMNDPVSVIESLEPVLNPSSVFVREGSNDSTSTDLEDGREKIPIKECASQGLHDLWGFLQSSNTELRLFLWSRLSEAYGAIKYTTKQFSCRLRSIEMVVADLTSDAYLKTPDESRRAVFMKLLKALDELLIQALTLALNEAASFEIIDDDHLRSSSSALARINCLLHTAAICEDEMRIASTLPSPTSTSALQLFLNKLREMQVRAWSLQYTLFRAGIRVNTEIFTNPDNDLAEFLAAVHHVLGIRKFCKASNKIFLKMMRVELLKLSTIENWEDYLGQVLYDLHGLKLGVGMWEVEDHQCQPEKLEKRTTIHLVERITILASRMPIKELLKSDLKTTIERMQQTMGQTKSTPQMIHNLRNFTEFLKRPIHPLRLYDARKGNVTLDAVGINTTESNIAKHGWFFLLGMIALTKFKGVDLNRRQTPGATDDLRIAATFMRLQLQFTPGKWDAWFRLAECFDYELDEAVLWTADKMNKDRAELVKLQRSAIHCYTLALSNSRGVDPGGEDSGTLYELYHKFGMRLYASSREPFAMEAFQHADQKRFFIAAVGSGTYQRAVHDEMTEYRVWKYAAWLFSRAMAIRPKDWKNQYMRSKCLWKMYWKSDLDKESLPQVLSALREATAVAAAIPKSRHSDPIVEPHYKILSVLHKLVMDQQIEGGVAAEILAEQPFGLPFGEDKSALDDKGTWVEYVLKSLRHLRDKDKSNWQHRLIMRHANILFYDDEDEGGDQGFLKIPARAAFNVLRESMFTKTMVMNVWKCDAERAGRHHVYTEQYIRFMVKLLVILEDRVNLEAVLRRIRKKGADFYHFSDLWQSCCVAYVQLLRTTYNVAPTLDDAFKSVGMEEFEGNTENVLEWASKDPEAPALGCLKDAIELKKLNANLMKATVIDDLISDCYTMIYLDARPVAEEEKVAETAEASAAQSPEAMAVDEEAKVVDANEGGGEKSRGELGGALGASDVDGAGSNAPTEAEAERENEVVPAAAVSKSRRAGVRRPDILRKAENIVQRLLEPKVESAGSKSRAASVSSGKNAAGGDGDASDVEMEDAAGGDETKDEDETKEGEGEGGAGAGARDTEEDGGGAQEGGSSPLGSVHEADESDLSDVPHDDEEAEKEEEEGKGEKEEDKEKAEGEKKEKDVPMRPLLFPNLRRSSEGGKGRRSSGEE
ncbi:related to transcriptional corepressor HIR3 [Cephalotrichum gorgonifer]|uniref:Histone transcription regulator 3 homolog n=1 Tax=Cephalotrichum gorgonifer TaxID=2041049 RepID=A0AAE8N0Z3_9PEZI|nr:related to transcriptional corepressor HIR3 [Cephalotrichum gorgonifer]